MIIPKFGSAGIVLKQVVEAAKCMVRSGGIFFRTKRTVPPTVRSYLNATRICFRIGLRDESD
jgi:hypothetical protein